RSGWSSVVPACDRYHAERDVAHGRGHDGGHRGVEQHSDCRVRAQPASGREAGEGSGLHRFALATSPGSDDFARLVAWLDSTGNEPRHRRRSLRALGERIYRRTAGIGSGAGLSRPRRLLVVPLQGGESNGGDRGLMRPNKFALWVVAIPLFAFGQTSW